MHGIATALALAALLLVGASAQQQQPAPPALNAEEASMLGYGDREKTCLEWTDGCMSCTRGGTGDPQCSNIPIACQPKGIGCTTRR